MATYKELIEEQELKDRYIASQCLRHILNEGKNKVRIKPAGITSHIDLRCSFMNIPFYVEIKERYKDDVTLEEYPYAELKVKKYRSMCSITPDNVQLYYMVLLNEEKCMLFNLDRLDWNKVKTVTWHIKKTQYWDQSYYVDTPVYMIPYNLAEVTCDCSQYYDEYKMMTS
jgi:hypothetical protein